jgi:hypothetical protein
MTGRHLTLSLGALLALSVPATAPARTADELMASGQVMIRARVEPQETVYVGQKVRLWVDVLTRTWFRQAPRYPTALEVEKAIVLPPATFGVNATERIGGETYAVQSRSYTIFPQTPGRFEVPEVEVRIVVALEDASPSPELTLRTPPASFEARLPEEAEGLGLVLATPQLTVREEYSRPLADLETGQSFRRTVSMTIRDAVGMLLPVLSFEAAEGIAVYPERPEVSDRSYRGRLTGTRIESVTYVMEKEGTYHLPELVLHWWDLTTAQLRKEVLPEVELEVAFDPDLAPEHLGETEEEREEVAAAPVEEERPWSWWQVAVSGAAVLVLLVLARRLRTLLHRRGSQLQPKVEAETAYFRRFRKAALSGDTPATFRHLVAWLDRQQKGERAATLRAFAAEAGDPELTRQAMALDTVLFGRPGSREQELAEGTWSGRRFYRRVAAARQRRGRKTPAPKEGRLTPLNPLGWGPAQPP